MTESKRRPNEQVKRQAPRSQYLITMAMLLIKGCATTRIYPRVLNLRLRPFQILFQRVASKVHHFLLSLRPGVRVRQNCLLTSFSFSLLTVPYRCGIKKKKKKIQKENMQRCKSKRKSEMIQKLDSKAPHVSPKTLGMPHCYAKTYGPTSCDPRLLWVRQTKEGSKGDGERKGRQRHNQHFKLCDPL